jgi:hypothetical protein
VRPLNLDPGTPLRAWREHVGSRVRLSCGLCGWCRDYDPGRIVARLKAIRRGDAETAVAAVALNIQWPCPGCGRLKWRTGLAGP